MKGEVLNLMESYIKDAGDKKEGIKRGAKRLVEEMRKPAFKAHKVSVREIFDATVVMENEDFDLATASNQRLAEAIGHSNFPFITQELISKELIPAYETGLNGVDMLVTEGETTKATYEDVAGIRGITKLLRVYPGQNYPSADMGEKNVRLFIGKFGQILDLEKELILADQTGEILDRARKAGEAMGEHRQQYIVETIQVAPRTALEEAASTAFYYGGSATTAANFYNNDHSAIFDDGQTNDNLAASSAVGTTASWDTALGLLMNMKDEKGRQITVMPKGVLVNPISWRKAWAQATDAGLSSVDTANRGGNFYLQKLGLQVIASPFVGTQTGGTTTDWYMGDFKKQLKWLWQFRPAVEAQGASSDAAFERDIVARFKYSYSGAVGHLDYRLLVKATA